MRLRYLLIFLIPVVIFWLFKTRKYYVCYDTKWNDTAFFTIEQLRELDKKDSILALRFGAVMYVKRENIAFYIFSTSDFETLNIKTIEVICDGKKKTLKYNVVYYPELKKIPTYKFDGKTVDGYERYCYPGRLFYNTCWLNVYDIFKWKHGQIGDKFDVKMIVDYELDGRRYKQELEYEAECRVSYPDTLL